LFLRHEPAAFAAFDNVYPDCGIGYTNTLCHYQRVVEDIYPHRSDWWRAGSVAGILFYA
jgi:hypothetical protein